MKKYVTTYQTGSFRQYTRRVFGSAEGLFCEKVVSVGTDRDGRLYAGTDNGLFRFENGLFVPIASPFEDAVITVIFFSSDGTMYLAAGDTLSATAPDGAVSRVGFSSAVKAMSEDEDGTLWILTESVLYKKTAGKDGWAFTIGVPGKGSCLTPYGGGRVYVGTKDNGLYSLVGKRWHWCELKRENTAILSDCVNCVDKDGFGNVWIGTDKGVCVYDDKGFWLDCGKVPSLPSLSVNGILRAPDGDVYFASAKALIRLHNGKLSYYGWKRWLPDPEVTALAYTDGTVWALTKAGLTGFAMTEMTLEEKAVALRNVTEKYNVRKDGYVLTRTLDNEGVVAEDEGRILSTDNDGLRTGVYTAALCFEYACTGNEEVKKLARRSLNAMLKLTRITGVEGFTARALRYPDEADFGTGARHEWHETTDENGQRTEWLGETSSDEMVGHFYCYANYYDLAADEEEKALIRETVTKILDHIIGHDFRLVDTDGKPTTWANWNPELLNNDNKWIYEKGTNSLQILTFLKIGEHVTGNAKYGELFRYLAREKHYAMNLMQYRILDGHLCHIDDNHDFLMISLLMRYTEEPDLRSVFAMGLDYHWQDEKEERNAFYNFVYGAVTGDAFNADDALEELYDYPMDQIAWSLYNSYRPDLDWNLAPAEMGMVPQLYSPLPAHERRITDNDCNRFVADNGAEEMIDGGQNGGNDPTAYNVLPDTGCDKGTELMPCTNFTHPYWYARYHGLIR